jgi:hypothetical protein
MWIDASVSRHTLLSDGVRLLGGGYSDGCHVWSLDTGEPLHAIGNEYGDFALAPQERAIVRTTNLETVIYDLSGTRRGAGYGRFRGFSRDGAHLFCEPLIRDIAVGVFDVEATYVGALPTGLTRPRANYHPAMDDLSSEEIFASSGGPSICRVVDLRDRKYVIETSENLIIRALDDATELLNVSGQRLCAATDDGQRFVTTDENGVTVYETSSDRSERISVATTRDTVAIDRTGRLLCPYHEGVQKLLVVDPHTGTRRHDVTVGSWRLVRLLPGNGVLAIAVGARNVTFVDVERGRVVETIERDDDLVCSAAEHAVVATITKAGRFEVWNVEPPILIERAELPSDPDAISVGPRHVVVKYTDGLLVRPRPPAR